jgi:hypothetical protein
VRLLPLLLLFYLFTLVRSLDDVEAKKNMRSVLLCVGFEHPLTSSRPRCLCFDF